ncbi:MAG: YesL family protein [Chloroflexota bacterium]
MRILRFYWQSAKHLNYRGYVYIWANLLWIALSLLVITAPAAWAGLSVLAHRSHTKRQVTLDDFWDGFKQYFWIASLNGVITFLIFVVNLSNLVNYTTNGFIGTMIVLVWVTALLLWSAIQLYLWSTYEELKEPSLWLAYRNAFVMVMRNMIFTTFVLVGVVLTLLLSIILPPLIILLTGSMLAILGTGGALNCLRQAGFHNPEHHNPIEQPHDSNHSR